MVRNLVTILVLICCVSLALSACDVSTGPENAGTSPIAEGGPDTKNDSPKESQDTASSPDTDKRQKAAASEKAIIPGSYGGLLLGLGPKGELTGYYSDGVGDDGKGNPRFSCVFSLYGEAKEGGGFNVTSWYPERNPENVLRGQLKSVEEDGKQGVNIKLDEDPCAAMLASGLETEEGADFLLDSRADWIGIRVVSAAKAFFYSSPREDSRKEAFVVENDVVALLREEGKWAEVDYTNEDGDSVRGWMKTSDFFAYKL